MLEKLKKYIVKSPWLVIPAFVFVNTVYLSPPTPLTKNIKVDLNQFMNAYYPQGWELFAPTPGYTSIKMLIRCKEDGKKVYTDWFDPTDKILKEHYESRFSTAGLLMKQYKFVATELKNSIVRKKKKLCLNGAPQECLTFEDAVEESQHMKLAHKYTKKMCSEKYPGSRAYSFKLIEFHPQPYTLRHLEDRVSRVDNILTRDGAI